MVHFPVQESCADLLLKVLAQTGGDAVVLHAGDTPYIVGVAGEQALARAALTPNAVENLARQLLPRQALQSLGEFGAIEHDCLTTGAPGAHFKVVAGQMDDELWIEVRRMRDDDDILSLPPAHELWKQN